MDWAEAWETAIKLNRAQRMQALKSFIIDELPE